LGQAGERLQRLISAIPGGLGELGCKGFVQTAVKTGAVFRTQAGDESCIAVVSVSLELAKLQYNFTAALCNPMLQIPRGPG